MDGANMDLWRFLRRVDSLPWLSMRSSFYSLMIGPMYVLCFNAISHIHLLQVMRCVREARQTAITREVDTSSFRAVAPAYAEQAYAFALRVKSWLPGSYARFDEFLPCGNVYLTSWVESVASKTRGSALRAYYCCRIIVLPHNQKMQLGI